MMTSAASIVAGILLSSGAVSLRPDDPFVYTSGIISPIYCDNRVLISMPQERRQIAQYLANTVPSSVDVIAGTATAGIPWAAWVAEILDKPMIYVRGEDKTHGKKQRIEGRLIPTQNVVVVEDLISTAKSSVSTVEALRESGAHVQEISAIFSYELLQSQVALESATVELRAVSTFSVLTQCAFETGRISENDLSLLTTWQTTQNETFRSSAEVS